jgi:hypothetical protein
MNSRLRLTVAIAAAALIGTGCSHPPSRGDTDNGPTSAAGTSNSANASDVASANESASASASVSAIAGASAPPLSAHEQGVKFAECMRANGVPHFPDPDPKGETNFGVDVTRDVWLKAVDACKTLEPPGALSSTRTPKEQAATLKFAQCVRDHGVKDFPDPINGQPLIDTYKIPSSNKPGGMAILNAATTECGSILKQAAGGQG